MFGPHGLLARELSSYEERPAQRELAAAVERTLHEGGILLAEAGTGTGKTLAYLAPAVDLGRRVVVSTGTRNLQEQLVSKDIPLLARALGRPLRVAVMKGRANYVCRTRLHSFEASGSFRRLEELPYFRAVQHWAPYTETGDRAEVPGLPDTVDFWREISAVSENCVGSSCTEFENCWITRMRQQALAADVVVVNHHLLCADLAVKESSFGQVIPDYDTVILDEAHLLEDVATQYFGSHVSTHKVDDLVRDVEREVSAAFLGRGLAGSTGVSTLLREARAARLTSETFFRLLHGGTNGQRRLAPEWMRPADHEAFDALLGRLEGIKTAVMALPERPEPVTQLATRATELAAQLGFVAAADADSHVYFTETRGKGVFLRALPIDVSGLLRQHLFGQTRAAVLTSATLAVDGGYDYLRNRLGLGACTELTLASPYDYPQQAILYVPRRMPEPRSPLFAERAADEVVRLLEISRGRAFVLFTSYANMNAVASRVASRISFPILLQGEAPRAELVDTFRRTPNAVLFATSSFWQGVDVVGDQLSCVIIDKLPFASPGDPVVSARVDRIRKAGGEPFSEYQVPVAVLALKQGLGRLIRSASDRGILAVLDSRLVEKSYGRTFLTSLPPARLVHDTRELETFLGP